MASITAPTSESSSDLADWLEVSAVIEGVSRLSRSRVRRMFREALGLDGSELDEVVDLTFSEMDRRVDTIGEGYPFQRDHSGFRVLRELTAGPYVFMLLVSSSPAFREAKEQHVVAQIFEDVIVEAIARYLGSAACCLRFGTPASGDRPTGWDDALHWLGRRLKVARGPSRQNPRKQDGGVDVVGWIPFPDSRAGHLVLLAQATIERDWWSSQKHHDINPVAWLGWLDLGAIPSVAFAIPFAVPANFVHWDELRRHVSVILDRIRLCSVFGADYSLGDAARNWTLAEAGRLAA